MAGRQAGNVEVESALEMVSDQVSPATATREAVR